MIGLRHFGMVCWVKQEFDSDCHRTNKICILADGLAKSDEVAVGEWGGDFRGESYGNSMPDLEYVCAMMGG